MVKFMNWSDDLQVALRRPFPATAVKFKPGSVSRDKTRALAQAYIDARVVMERLDRLVGVQGWSTEFTPISIGGEEGLECAMTVLGVTKRDVGKPAKFETVKSAYSDALKRAAVLFGVGRYLYAIPGQWCDYDDQYNRFKGMPTLPKWALPGNEDTVDQEALPDVEPDAVVSDGPKATDEQKAEITDRLTIMGRGNIDESLQAAGFAPLSVISETDAAAAIDRLKNKHWSKNEVELRRFWVRVKTECGVSGSGAVDTVHMALSVEHLVDYLGTIDQAVETIKAWADAGVPDEGVTE